MEVRCAIVTGSTSIVNKTLTVIVDTLIMIARRKGLKAPHPLIQESQREDQKVSTIPPHSLLCQQPLLLSSTSGDDGGHYEEALD